jgi:hypothetical protein
MVFKAKLRKMEYDVRMGKLVEAELVKQRWSAVLRLIVDRILAWPNRLAPEVATLTDERQVREAILREARALINDLRSEVQYAR